MPKDNNDIGNDDLVMDESIQPQKNGVDSIFQQYIPKQDRKSVIPFVLGFFASLALVIGLCFVSAWFAFGLIVPVGLLMMAINNNTYNNKQEAKEWEYTPTPTPTPDLVVEHTINNQKQPNYNKSNVPENKDMPMGNQNTKETKENEKIFKQDFNGNFKNNQDNKSNVETKTNLDLINKIQKDGNLIEK